jgi:hypothetical protein
MKCDTKFSYKFFITTFSHIGHKLPVRFLFYVFDVHCIGKQWHLLKLIDVLIIIFHVFNSDNFLLCRKNDMFPSFWIEYIENLCFMVGKPPWIIFVA